MGFLDRILHKNKMQDSVTPIAVHGLLSGGGQSSLSQDQLIEQLGINIHMIEDEILKVAHANFIQQYTRDKEGNPTPTGPPDLNMLALLWLSSKLIRTSFLEPIDSKIGMLTTELMISRMELMMEKRTYELGGTNLIEAIGEVIMTAYADAMNGRKAKLLKLSGRTTELRIPEQKALEKSGSLIM